MPNDPQAQRILQDLIDGKLRGAPTGPELVGSIVKRVLPIVDAACVEPDEPSERADTR